MTHQKVPVCVHANVHWDLKIYCLSAETLKDLQSIVWYLIKPQVAIHELKYKINKARNGT